MRLGLVGLGRMGAGMRERLRRGGHEVVGYSRHGGDVESLAALVRALEAPRVVWTMVPAGEPTESVVSEIGGLLGAGDIVVEGGNSNFHDSIRRGGALAARGIAFIDAGVSGGVWGLENGYCLMVGGAAEAVAVVRPAFETLAPEGGFAHVGPLGAGHFTKMVHNGIEYGLMQSYAEGFELLGASPLRIDVHGAIEVWRNGSVVRSWLLDLLAQALEQNPSLEGVQGYAADSGEGRWTVQTAVDLAVPVPAISAALYARFSSRQDQSPAMKAIAVLREQFGGHEVKRAE